MCPLIFVPARSVRRYYQAHITPMVFGKAAPELWADVPDEVVIFNKPNPTGAAVACWYANQVRCFVLPRIT